VHRSLHSLADILLLGRESGQGGPNLREGGGGQSGLNQHFGSYLCKKDTSISSSPPHVSPGFPLPVHAAHRDMLQQPPPTHTHRHQGQWRAKYLG
jgi:hypothetical protein